MRLAQQAKVERRSLARQAVVLLERALDQSPEHRSRRRTLLDRISATAFQPRIPEHLSPERLIRKDRER